MVWDQAERDVHCLPQSSGGPGPENETSRYACMERELVRSWRSAFKSDFNFVGVQLPGYGTRVDNCTPREREGSNSHFTTTRQCGASVRVSWVAPNHLEHRFGVYTPS